jgi:hypothetical protein
MLVALASARGASAQDAGGAPGGGRFRFGPLRFTPSIVLGQIGVDNNVFNEAENPKEDRTAAFGPAVDMWMGLGPSRLSGRVGGQYLYYQKYANQRAMNTSDTLRWEFPLGRVMPYIEGTYNNSKGLSGFEIQSRVRQISESVALGGEWRMSGRTTIALSGTRSRTQYADKDAYLGVSLSEQLSGSTQSELAQLKYRLTSLTTFVASAEALQDRFDALPLRNANSIRVLPGFELKSAALISGRVFVGFRRLSPLDPTVPAFQGLVSSVDARTVIRSRLQLGVQVGRDVAFSYQPEQPYYLLTDATLTLTQRIGTSWDVVARGGRQTLDYSRVNRAVPLTVVVDDLGSPVPVATAQKDVIRQFGGGIGYRFGRIMRLGIDGSFYRRVSSSPLIPQFEGLRIGASISYGLPQ